MISITSASDKGRALYRAIWETVGATFFDTSRLGQWSSWEHRFDEQIDGEDSALRYADEMLASLNDTYTERVLAPTAVSSSASASEASAKSDADEPPPDVMAVLTKDNLGYLRISTFDRQDIGQLVAVALNKIAGCDGVVLDLRQNSGGRMDQALDCLGFFLANGLLSTLEFRHEDGIKRRQYFINETQFFSVETLPDGTQMEPEMYTRRPPVLAGKPIVVLINRRTASAGEIMVVTLVQNGQEGKVLMVGSGETPGKGIGQAEYVILDGLATIRVTRCRWLCPGGEWLGDCGQTERNGIAPDTIVPDDHGPEALKVGFDELRKMLGL